MIAQQQKQAPKTYQSTQKSSPKGHEHYKCKGCNRVFSSKNRFLQHMRNSLWEFYYTIKEDGKYTCTICGAKFININQFVEHWVFDFSHDDRALEKILFVQKRLDDEDSWVVRPVHEERVKRHIRTDKEKFVLRYNIDRTKFMVRELLHGYKYDEWNVVEIVGPTGSGKSVIALYLAIWMIIQYWKMTGIVADYHIGFSFTETQDFTTDAKRGDVIIQDEDPEAVGEGSQWYRDNIENLMTHLRASGINYIFVSPRNIKYLQNQQFILEAYKKNYKRRVNKVALYDNEQAALGWVYIPILPKADPAMVEYLTMKMTNIERIKRQGGSHSVKVRASKFIHDVTDAFEFMTQSDLFTMRQLQEMGVDEIFGHISSIVSGVGAYQKNVARAVRRKLEEPFERDSDIERDYGPVSFDDDERDGSNISFRTIMTGEDMRVLQKIYDYAQPKTQQEMLGKLWWKYRMIMGMKQEGAYEACNEEANVTKSRVAYLNTFFPAFELAQHCLGTGTELAVRELYFADAKHVGGSGKPDIVGHDYAVEVKARPWSDQRTMSAIIKDILRNEENSYLKEIINKRGNLKFVLVRYNDKRCVIEMSEIVYTEIDDVIEEPPAPTEMRAAEKKRAEMNADGIDAFMTSCVALAKLSGIDELRKTLDQKKDLQKGTREAIVQYAMIVLKGDSK